MNQTGTDWWTDIDWANATKDTHENKVSGQAQKRDNRDGSILLHLVAECCKCTGLINSLLDEMERDKVKDRVNARDISGRSPLHLAAMGNERGDVIAALIHNAANAHARDKYGNTPLHLAALHNKNPDVITTLIEKGADPKARNKDGQTALDLGERNSDFYKSDVYWKLNDATYN